MKKLFTLLFLISIVTFSWSQDHTVLTSGQTFVPQHITVFNGQTVEWQNTGGNHNVNATQAAYPNNPESFGNSVGAGWTFQHTFGAAGFYNYHCDPHVSIGMTGTVTVLNTLYPIGLVTADSDGNGEADSVGVDCSITGVVYGIDMQGGGNIQFTIIGSDNEGIGLFSSNDFGYTVTEGDEVTISGTISSFNGLAQISPDTLILNSSGNTLVTPTDVTALDETTESQLVRLTNVTLVDPADWTGSGSFNVDVTDGTNTYTLRLDSDVDLASMPAPVGTFNVTGLGGQYDNSDPYTSGYQLLPRYAADIELVQMPTTPALMITGVVDPQPGGSGAKAIELYALQDIPDMSIYGVGAANNGGGTDSVEFSFPADAVTAGTCITYTDSSNATKFLEFFGVDATYLVSTAAGINGNDAIELFENGTLIDVFGDADVDGVGTDWEYTDGFAYRKSGMMPSTTFVVSDWVYSGVDALQSSTFQPNTDFLIPFPLCTYSPVAPTQIEANDDNVTLDIDVASNIDILANDVVPSGITTTSIVTMPTQGTATTNGAPQFDITYTPTMGFCGQDSLVYEICDANGCAQASVYITIECPPSYPAYDIGTVVGDSDGDGLADSLGITCELTGVVYGGDLDGNDGISFTIIDANGDGIKVFEHTDVSDYIVVEGDEITVQGEISQFNGLTQMRPAVIGLNSVNNTLVTPTDVTALGEDTESQLIRMTNMTLVDATQWTGSGSGFNVDITDGTNTFQMRIDNDVDLYSAAAPVGTFHVTGIGGQYDSSDPYTEGYQILPRYVADIEEAVATNNPELGNQINVFPNPTKASLHITSEVQLDNIRVVNILGQQIVDLHQPNTAETLNVSDWQSGIYVITFISGNQVWTSQFVKQ